MVTFINGDSREALRGLPDQSVHCCITSPPYFGLRDYGTGTWEGGSPECDHAPVSGNQGATGQRATRTFTGAAPQLDICSRCGARRADRQIGLEPTLEAYINELMTVFAEVKRVLRDDGTFWLNLGDSYAANRGYQVSDSKHKGHDFGRSNAGRVPDGLRPKSLIGMPWRVAFTLQADGWILRSDIIWAKGNPMPESVTDRPTRCHEYLFMFAKSERYHYDYAAVREEGVIPAGTRGAKGSAERAAIAGVNSRPPEYKVYDGFRNRRSVWNVNTRPFPGAHFATFPPALVEPALLAGCPVGGTVLDPFAGAGTVGLVAEQHGRNAILVELNPSYVTLAKERLCAAT
jgi:DNA modification methylase